MTPEEWAAKAHNALMEGGARTFEGCVAWAVRKAVEAEREACLSIAASKTQITRRNTAVEIYDEIRARSCNACATGISNQ